MSGSKPKGLHKETNKGRARIDITSERSPTQYPTRLSNQKYYQTLQFTMSDTGEEMEI